MVDVHRGGVDPRGLGRGISASSATRYERAHVRIRCPTTTYRLKLRLCHVSIFAETRGGSEGITVVKVDDGVDDRGKEARHTRQNHWSDGGLNLQESVGVEQSKVVCSTVDLTDLETYGGAYKASTLLKGSIVSR